ncbi:MAG: anhydro-N-acetylmuramic acid kinase [Phycisphaerales bacterium]
MERLVVGCMTGTSIDALDAALVRVRGRGLEMTAEFVRGVTRPLGELAAPLRRLAEQGAMTAGEIASLSREFSLLHVEAVREAAGGEKIDLVCVHGQTVFHGPPASWQLLTPAVIAQGLGEGVAVVSDLRAADLACGGQGAPITPIADWVLFRGVGDRGAVANLGGFCNITLLGAKGEGIEAVRAMDVCACSQLLDAIARKLMNVPFDANGERAAAGHVHTEAMEDLEGVLAAQAGSRRSLGTGDEVGEWISRYRARVSGDDLAATACEGIAQTIAHKLDSCERLLLAGGGVRNAALVRAIGSCCSAVVETTDKHGVPAEFREAIEFAVLGALCQDRVPITLGAVTGVKAPPVAGTWVMP